MLVTREGPTDASRFEAAGNEQCSARGRPLIVTAPPTAALTPPLPEHAKAQISDVAVRLAANSIANIPTNLFRILADIPMNQLIGINAASESLEGSGNWWLYTPTNALGWDQMDYAKAVGFTKMFTPIPEVAQAQADQLNAIMARNFPMTRPVPAFPDRALIPTTSRRTSARRHSKRYSDTVHLRRRVHHPGSVDRDAVVQSDGQVRSVRAGQGALGGFDQGSRGGLEHQRTFCRTAWRPHRCWVALQLLQPVRRRHLLCALPVTRGQGSTQLTCR